MSRGLVKISRFCRHMESRRRPNHSAFYSSDGAEGALVRTWPTTCDKAWLKQLNIYWWFAMVLPRAKDLMTVDLFYLSRLRSNIPLDALLHQFYEDFVHMQKDAYVAIVGEAEWVVHWFGGLTSCCPHFGPQVSLDKTLRPKLLQDAHIQTVSLSLCGANPYCNNLKLLLVFFRHSILPLLFQKIINRRLSKRLPSLHPAFQL